MTTDDVAAAVIKRLIGKVVIHRLDAYSTNSIYLKFDYGIVNSLRISDHEGKKHLSYRYNILLDQQVREVRHMNGYDRILSRQPARSWTRKKRRLSAAAAQR